MNERRSNPVRTTWRQRWFRVHLYLGLALGTNFLLMGVTGSLLVFHQVFDRWLNPELRIEVPDGTPLSANDWLLVVQQTSPELSGSWQFQFPRGTDEPVRGVYLGTERDSAPDTHPPMVWIHPVTKKILKRSRWGETGMTWIYDLHFTLLLGQPGMMVVAIIGITMLTTLLTGLSLWWPSRGAWKQAFQIRLSPTRHRFSLDLHKVGGASSACVLLLLGGTGVCMNLPDSIEPMIETLSPGSLVPQVVSTAQAGKEPLLPDAVLTLVNRQFPGSAVQLLTTPKDHTDIYAVTFLEQGQPNRSSAWSQIVVDQYTGSILASQRPQSRTRGAGFLSWLLPLHNGEALSFAGRIVVFIAGFMPAVLFGTGLFVWWRKQRSKAVSKLGKPDR